MTILLRKINLYTTKKFHLYRSRNWKEIEYFDETWKKRIGRMAQLIDRHAKSVADLGCGRCWLKEVLPPGIKYIGVDYQPRECADTLVCDFNAGQFPNIKADVVFCSGILEYLEDLPTFVQNICQITNQIIWSYCSTDYIADIRTRGYRGWKNHFSSLDVISMFLEQGPVLTDINLEIQGNPIFCMKCNIDKKVV